MCRTQPFRENGNFTTSKEYSHSQLSPALLSPPHVLYFSDFWLVYWSFESVCEKILWCILVFVQTYATTIFVCVHLPKAVSSWTIIIVFRSLTKKILFFCLNANRWKWIYTAARQLPNLRRESLPSCFWTNFSEIRAFCSEKSRNPSGISFPHICPRLTIKVIKKIRQM